MRAFVALWPTAPVRRTLGLLDRPEHPDVRWIPEARWHVTLAFLGEVEPSCFPSMAAVLADVARGSEVVTATLGPRTERGGPGVLWVPVGGLDALAASVRRAFGSAGGGGDSEEFVGHLTLARSRGRRRLPSDLAGVALDHHLGRR